MIDPGSRGSDSKGYLGDLLLSAYKPTTRMPQNDRSHQNCYRCFPLPPLFIFCWHFPSKKNTTDLEGILKLTWLSLIKAILLLKSTMSSFVLLSSPNDSSNVNTTTTTTCQNVEQRNGFESCWDFAPDPICLFPANFQKLTLIEKFKALDINTSKDL